MNLKVVIIAAAASVSLGVSFQAIAAEGRKGTTSYKWVDEQGVTHYGQVVPPEFATRDRAELNGRGVPVRQFPRQLSPAEAEDAQKSAADTARMRQHDSFLLQTYTKVSDIENLRDERMALIDGQMEIARGSIAAADQRMQSLETRIKNFYPYSKLPNARRLPDQLAEEVVRTMNERRMLDTALQKREKEKTEVRSEFDGDIARYRELTSRPKSR
jgi:Domain of unknown function (DUF4124)